MAKKQNILNSSPDYLFHKIQGSECKTPAQPPMLKGMGVPMTDVTSPNKFLPALAIGAKILGGLAVRQGVKYGAKKLFKKAATNFIKKRGVNFAINSGKTGAARYGTAANTIKKVANVTLGKSKLGKGLSYLGFGSLFLGGSGDSKQPESSNLPDVSSSGPKNPVSKSDPYSDALKKDSNLPSYIKTRNSSKKGSQAYVDAQNKINAAYGVSKRHKVTSAPVNTPSNNNTKVSVSPPSASVDVKPKPVNNPAANVSSSDGIKTKKQIKKAKLDNKAALAAAKGNFRKAHRLNKRSNRVEPNLDYYNNISGSPFKALADLAPHLGEGENKIDPNSKFGKKIKADAGIPYTSRIQASVQGSPFKAGCGSHKKK
jgi:hypothetical protein